MGIQKDRAAGVRALILSRESIAGVLNLKGLMTVISVIPDDDILRTGASALNKVRLNVGLLKDLL